MEEKYRPVILLGIYFSKTKNIGKCLFNMKCDYTKFSDLVCNMLGLSHLSKVSIKFEKKLLSSGNLLYINKGKHYKTTWFAEKFSYSYISISMMAPLVVE